MRSHDTRMTGQDGAVCSRHGQADADFYCLEYVHVKTYSTVLQTTWMPSQLVPPHWKGFQAATVSRARSCSTSISWREGLLLCFCLMTGKATCTGWIGHQLLRGSKQSES